MADETVRVQITADVSSLQAGMAQAQSAAASAMQQISLAVDQGTRSYSQLEIALTTVSPAIQEAGKTAEESVGGIEHLSSALKSGLQATGVFLLIEGFSKLKDAIAQTTERAVEIHTMAEVLSVTTAQFQAMQVAAEEAGVSSEQFGRATERLVQMLLAARDGSGAAVEKMLEMGITTAQIADKTFGTNELLQVLHERLNDSSTASETMAAITKELGARMAVAAEALKEYEGSAAGVAARDAEINALSDQQIGRLKEIHAWWGEVGTAIANAASKAVVWIAEANSGFAKLSDDYREVADAAEAANGVPQAKAAADAKAAIAQQSAQAQIAVAHQVTLAEVEAVHDSIDAFKQGSAERLEVTKQYAALAAQYYGSDQVDKVREANKAVVAEERSHSEELERVAAERTSALEQYDKKRLELVSREIEESGKYLDDQVKQQRAAAEAEKQAALEQIRIRQELLASQGSAGGNVGAQNALLQEQLAAYSRYYNAISALAAGNAAEQMKIQGQLAAESEKTAAEILKNNTKAAQELTKQWESAIKPIGTAFEQTINGMITHTTSFQQAVRRMGLDVLKDVEHVALTQAEKWAASELAKTGATLTGNAARVASTSIAATETLAIEGAAALKSIIIYAYKAAAGAFSAVASIPYVGPFLAVAAGAAILAEVINLASHLSFAEGGIVPYDTMAQVHGGEMVLPRNISEGLQNTFGDGRGGGRHGNDTHIHAWDGRSVERWLSSSKNRNALAKSIRQAHNSGSPHLRGMRTR